MDAGFMNVFLFMGIGAALAIGGTLLCIALGKIDV